tara:strand:- start:542 stop:1144 length:603 start_codon:yes stop_codon:yes gene_type:complete
MKTNKELRASSIEALKGRWGLAVGGYLIFNLITVVLSNIPLAGFFATIIISGPLALGLVFFSLKIARKEEAKIEVLFEGFNDFTRALTAYLLYFIYIFLWSLLLIVPGIIKAISYSQTFYILGEDDTIGAEDAIKKSMQMMDGYKAKWFGLSLSFIGWGLLCLLTLGIGFLWLIPYIQVSYAKFYLNLKEEFDNKLTAIE